MFGTVNLYKKKLAQLCRPKTCKSTCRPIQKFFQRVPAVLGNGARPLNADIYVVAICGRRRTLNEAA